MNLSHFTVRYLILLSLVFLPACSPPSGNHPSSVSIIPLIILIGVLLIVFSRRMSKNSAGSFNKNSSGEKEMKPGPIRNPLHDLFCYYDEKAQIEAARKLGSTGNKELVYPLIAALRDNLYCNVKVKQEISEAIKSIDPKVMEDFAAKHEDDWVWRYVPDLPGVEKLTQCTKNDIFEFYMKELLQQALVEIESAHKEGADALAQFIEQLIYSRSSSVIWALKFSQKVTPTPELVDMVRTILSTPPVRYKGFRENSGLFYPEIFSDVKVGWADSTYSKIKALAAETLRAFEHK